MRKIFFKSFILIFFTGGIIYSQTSIGGSTGGGTISGQSPAIGSFNTAFFFEFDPGVYDNVTTRLSFVYAQDFNAIVPETRDKYYSFMKAVNLKFLTDQIYEDNFYLEEGVGLVLINDRTFNDIDAWDYGVIFSLLGGIDFREMNNPGIRLGAGTDYAITFNRTLAKYFSLYLQIQYIF